MIASDINSNGSSSQMETSCEFSEERINELKKKYSVELRNVEDNPIKVCMTLIFEAATQKEPTKRDEISMRLSQFLMEPNGLINLFLALIDFDTSSQKVTTHNQRFMAVANIISCLPKLSIPYADYCANISRQLIPLLIHPVAQYPSLASLIIKALIESPHARKHKLASPEESIKDIVLKHILRPLGTSRSQSTNELSVSNAILSIRNLIQNRNPPKLFASIFPNLLYSLLTLSKTSSHLKAILKQILISILDDLKPGPACCLLDQTLLDGSRTLNIYAVIVKDTEITIEISEPVEYDSDELDELVIDLIENSSGDLLKLEFFFHFQARMWSCSDDETSRRCASLIEPLLTRSLEDPLDGKQDLFTSMATNSQRSLELITRAVCNYMQFFKNNKAHRFTNSSLISCIKILEVLCSSKQVDDSVLHTRTMPMLCEIRSSLIEDHQGADSELLKSISAFLDRFQACENAIPDNYEDKSTEEKHNAIMRDLNDDLVPVRVHALITLKQLVMANDRTTIERIPQLCSLVECSLSDQESYVFLASINLLAEMALRKTNEILPRLIDLHSRGDLDTHQRINVGEVLARLTKKLNKTTPYYAMQIMNALYAATSDNDELIRMSSLTNMGLVASGLGDSLSKYILDILLCVDRVLGSDSIQVKCAAIDLLRTTLMGLNRSNVESIQRELSSIYQALKKLRSTTLDEKMCLQTLLALDEIDRLAKELLGCPLERQQTEALVKNIKVLSLFK